MQALLPDTDKLSKLERRFHKPATGSDFSAFAGQQAFFKEFLEMADYHHVFVEHLRIILISELFELNDSTYEALNVSGNDDDDLNSDDKTTTNTGASTSSAANKATCEPSSHAAEYAVRSETIVKLRVIAKFIGLLAARSHDYAGVRCPDVDQRLLQQRQHIGVTFDVRSALIRALLARKLIVVVPWLVQYVAMLDVVTLRLAYFTDVLGLLVELQLQCAAGRLTIGRTSQFIVPACVGWLFDQPNVPPELYMQYRRSRQLATLVDGLLRSGGNGRGMQQQAIQVLMPVDLASTLVDYTLAVSMTTGPAVMNSDGQQLPQQLLQCTLQKSIVPQPACVSQLYQRPSASALDDIEHALSAATAEPTMEDILTAACPFLSDFRVAIMPLKHGKTISRSGRLLHITLKTAEPMLAHRVTIATPSAATSAAAVTTVSSAIAAVAPQNAQAVLAEAFLHSQSLSVRRTVDFCTERTVSAVIKDFQIEYIVPLKTATVARLQALSGVKDIANARHILTETYADAQRQLCTEWTKMIGAAIADRAERALSALLPHETTQAVRKVCIGLVKQRSGQKTGEWATANLNGIGEFEY